METIKKIIAGYGGMQALRKKHIRIENAPFMPLVIEYVGTGPREQPAVSVAHTYIQNGDVMYDPEVVFETGSDMCWGPISYRQDGFRWPTQVAVWKDVNGTVLLRPRLVASLRTFARQWDRNLLEQGYLQAQQSAGKG